MVSPVLEKRHILERLASERRRIKARGVRRLGLFGSFVHGRQNDESDVDFIVEFDRALKSYDNFESLVVLLEELLQRRVELLTTEALSPYLGPRILAELQDVSLDD